MSFHFSLATLHTGCFVGEALYSSPFWPLIRFSSVHPQLVHTDFTVSLRYLLPIGHSYQSGTLRPV